MLIGYLFLIDVVVIFLIQLFATEGTMADLIIVVIHVVFYSKNRITVITFMVRSWHCCFLDTHGRIHHECVNI